MTEINKVPTQGGSEAKIPDAPNPANLPPPQAAREAAPFRRIPVSSAKRKLEAPDIPGYNLYWFLERNVNAALQGGYVFVTPEETQLNQHGLANSQSLSGNTDLGSRVSIATTGGEGAERLYLMKIKLEWFQEDQTNLAKANARVLESIFRNEQIFDEKGQMTGTGGSTVYVNENSSFRGNRALFNRNRRLK